jgi:hypothetical protein
MLGTVWLLLLNNSVFKTMGPTVRVAHRDLIALSFICSGWFSGFFMSCLIQINWTPALKSALVVSHVSIGCISNILETRSMIVKQLCYTQMHLHMCVHVHTHMCMHAHVHTHRHHAGPSRLVQERTSRKEVGGVRWSSVPLSLQSVLLNLENSVDARVFYQLAISMLQESRASNK